MVYQIKCNMSLRKFPSLFRSIVVLCCLCIGFCISHCPDICQCYKNQLGEKVWNCSNVGSFSQFDNSSNILFEDEFQLPHVDHLIIQDSKIDFPEDLSQHFPNLKTLDLSNNLINCTKQLTWLLKLGEKFTRDPESVQCTSPQTFNGTQVLKALQLIYDVNYQCPPRCHCDLAHVPKDDQYVTISISCNNLGLTELPKNLPENVTIHMDLSNNRIEDISELAKNPKYNRVTVLYLANNRIQSLYSLENSKWIQQFNLLSLQGNLLQELPVQALSKVFYNQDISNGVRMLLSNNPWKCDCYTVTQFQPFIAKHKQLIKDVSNVTCGAEEGESAGKKIISIELSSVCENLEETLNLMDVLNVILAFLTLITIGKLLYDYYAYRKTGRLPWIASKLP